MASTFRGLETGKSGVNVAMLNLEVAGQNIANAKTDGYTRQRVVSTAKTPPGSEYVISQIYNKMVGQGAEVTDIQQLRSEYLDMQFRNLNSSCEYYDAKAQGMTYLTGVMNELDKDASITLCLDNFSKAMTKLAEDPASEEFRLNLQQSGVALTETIKYAYGEMIDLANSQNESISTVTQSINAKAEQLAALNTSIASYERSGSSANELRDQRNLLLDELSGLANIEYTVNPDNNSMLDVRIGGLLLVDGADTNGIEIAEAADPNPITGIKSWELTLDGVSLHSKYSGDPATANVTDGELFAHMELLENGTAENSGIPYYVTRLNELAQNVAKTVNGVHQTGFTYPDPENGKVSTDGYNFFKVPTEDADDGTGTMIPTENYSLITGGNFSLSDEVLQSVWNIAASDKQIDLTATTTNSGNKEAVLKMQRAFETGEVYSTLNTFVAHLAIASNTCSGLLKTNESLRKSVDSQRSSLSGVSLDEEATNIIMYKQSYNASSRVISAIDEMLDKLINGTGRVGV